MQNRAKATTSNHLLSIDQGVQSFEAPQFNRTRSFPKASGAQAWPQLFKYIKSIFGGNQRILKNIKTLQMFQATAWQPTGSRESCLSATECQCCSVLQHPASMIARYRDRDDSLQATGINFTQLITPAKAKSFAYFTRLIAVYAAPGTLSASR